MKEQLIQALAQALQNNLGNRVTAELANGILFALGNAIDAVEKDQPDD